MPVPLASAFAAFAGYLAHPVCTAAPDGAVTLVNDRWAELTGQPPEEAHGDGWLGCVLASERDEVEARYAAYIRRAAPFRLDVPLLSASGTPTTCQLQARPHHDDDDGGLRGWVGSFVRVDGPDVAEAPDRRRVMIVEDNREARFLLHRILQRTYDVTCATTVTEALEAAQRQSFDAVLIDIHLNGEMSGTALLDALRALPGYAATPMAAVTAYGLPDDQERFLRAGFARVLIKPFLAAQIQALAADLVSRSQPG